MSQRSSSVFGTKHRRGVVVGVIGLMSYNEEYVVWSSSSASRKGSKYKFPCKETY